MQLCAKFIVFLTSPPEIYFRKVFDIQEQCFDKVRFDPDYWIISYLFIYYFE